MDNTYKTKTMETNNPAPGPAINPNPEKNTRKIVMIVLSVLLATILILIILSLFSRWECKEGSWHRNGLPLSARPEAKCDDPRMVQNEKMNKSLQDEKKEVDSMPQPLFKTEEIEVSAPLSGSEVSSPLTVKGRAKGTWFFEGSFPLKLADAKGNIFSEGHASAEGEWMTTDWVNFSGTIEYSAGNASDGLLILEKDNPSGMASLDRAVSLPLKFKTDESATNAVESPNISNQCGHDPKNDPILGDCGEDCNTQNWQIYKSQKYGYSFRYPIDYVLTNSCKKGNCISEQEGGDTVTLSGDLSNQGWPMIEIRHLSTPAFNPPTDTDLPGWIKEKFPWTEKCFPNTANIYFTGKEGHLFGGFNLFIPRSPQAYSRREIYFLRDGKLFEILMLDAESPQARQFYDIWLSAFRAEG